MRFDSKYLIIFLLVSLMPMLILLGCGNSSVKQATSVQKEEQYKDGIVSLAFKHGGGNSSYGKAVIVYNTSDGTTKEINFNTCSGVELRDINNDGKREILAPKPIGYEMNVSHAELPYWYDIYTLDVTQGKLIYASANYPEYYRDVYIPQIEKQVKENSKLSLDSIKARATLIYLAQAIADGEYQPTQEGLSSVEDRFKYFVAQIGNTKNSSNVNQTQKSSIAKETIPAKNSIEKAIIGHWVSANQQTDHKSDRRTLAKQEVVKSIQPIHLYISPGKLVYIGQSGPVTHRYNITDSDEDTIYIKLGTGAEWVFFVKPGNQSFNLVQDLGNTGYLHLLSTMFTYVDDRQTP